MKPKGLVPWELAPQLVLEDTRAAKDTQHLQDVGFGVKGV